jgi:hypothetical protein
MGIAPKLLEMGRSTVTVRDERIWVVSEVGKLGLYNVPS